MVIRQESTASNTSRSLPKHPNIPGLSEFYNSHLLGPELLFPYDKAEGSSEELQSNKKSVRGPRTAMKSGPHLPQLEKALARNEDPTQLKVNK